MLKNILSAALVGGLSVTAFAQTLWLSEILVSPPGADNGFEGFELMSSTPNFDLTGYKLIILEGDGTTVPGVVDQILSLDGQSTGANGLFLWRDGSTEMVPAYDPLTNLFVQDFNPDIENGAQTYVLGRGDVPFVVGQDLDSDNDGTLDDLSLWSNFTVVDAVALQDGDTGGKEYADDLGGINLGIVPFINGEQGSYTPDDLYRVLNSAGTAPAGWAGGDLLGTSPGPYGWDFASDPPEVFGFPTFCLDATTFPADLGVLNQRNACVSTIDVQPSAFQVQQGDLAGGGLNELLEDDNLVLNIRQRAAASPATPNVGVIVSGQAPAGTVSQLDILVRAATTASPLANVIFRIEAFNYDANTWTRLYDTNPTGTGEQVYTFTVTGATADAHVGPAGEVSVRLRWFDRGAASPGWRSTVDQVRWTITR